MFAVQLLSAEIFPLKPCDSGESAGLFFDDWKVNWLPVVEGGKVLGVLGNKSANGHEDLRAEQMMQKDLSLYTVPEHFHAFELLERMHKSGFDTLAVLTAEEQYRGMVSAREIHQQLFEHAAMQQEGSLLVLEIPAIHYSLAELSRIIEGNETKVLHLYIEPVKDQENTLRVSLKLNRTYLNHVMASLERFGYRILYSNSPADPNRSVDERYQWLMKYLNT